MMKPLHDRTKIFRTLLVASNLLCLLFMASYSVADDDGTWTYTRWGFGARIAGCVETCPVELVIPDAVNGFSVIFIGDSALTGGLLILRNMFGLDGASLTAKTATSDAMYSDSDEATRTTEEIETHLNRLVP
jgi:hypothetical protein